MPKHQYDTDTKANTLAVLAATGGNLSATATQTGIPRKTIAYWASTTGMRSTPANGSTIGEQKRFGTEQDRQELAGLWQKAAEMNARELTDPEKVKKASLRENAIAGGTAQDKLAMLTGGLTGRTEHQIRVSLVAPDGRSFSSLREASLAVLEGEVRELPAGIAPRDNRSAELGVRDPRQSP